MALKKEVYKEFECVVGEENICNDPAIIPAYYNNKFAAVILPGNTAEVQAVVKLCNKHKLHFAVVSTGWMGMFPPDTILLDLRRMNRIIEINEKNMYAVVEPYVISSQLQAEVRDSSAQTVRTAARSRRMLFLYLYFGYPTMSEVITLFSFGMP